MDCAQLRDKNMNPCTTGASGPIQVTIVRKKDEAQMDVAVVDCQDGSYRVDYSVRSSSPSAFTESPFL